MHCIAEFTSSVQCPFPLVAWKNVSWSLKNLIFLWQCLRDNDADDDDDMQFEGNSKNITLKMTDDDNDDDNGVICGQFKEHKRERAGWATVRLGEHCSFPRVAVHSCNVHTCNGDVHNCNVHKYTRVACCKAHSYTQVHTCNGAHNYTQAACQAHSCYSSVHDCQVHSCNVHTSNGAHYYTHLITCK